MKFISTIKSKMKNNLLLNKKGQGATEYILLLVVVVGLVMMFGPKIKSAITGKVSDLEAGMQEIQAK